MPLRDDLLDPIAGECPSGPDLRYDPVFDKIKEARREDDESLPTGDWDRPVKRADHLQIVKLAGEALATRSKDLRLAASLIESQLKLEGLPVLAPSIALLHQIQEKYWETLHPENDEGDLEYRANAIAMAAKRMIPLIKEFPLTASGITAEEYRESRMVGYESAATTEERRNARRAAVEAKKLTAEDFDKAALATPKTFYVAAKAAMDAALQEAERLNQFNKDAYGDQYPELSLFESALQEAAGLFNLLLTERRKTEPDPSPVSEKAEPPTLLSDQKAQSAAISQAAATVAPVSPWISVETGALPATEADAYAQIVRSAQFLFEHDTQSPVPYLVCAGLRLGETFRQGSVPEPGFAIGPGSEVRRSLRRFAVGGAWGELLRASLPVMAEPCARAWLDLHRYIWRAAQETGANALAAAVSGTLRELLTQRPEVRHWTLEDDTGAANPETQAWIDAEVLASR